jgi:hypothetical protein
VRPTYLTNWEMIHCPEFVDLGRAWVTGSQVRRIRRATLARA